MQRLCSESVEYCQNFQRWSKSVFKLQRINIANHVLPCYLKKNQTSDKEFVSKIQDYKVKETHKNILPRKGV